jgi:hypothetical protein
MWLSIYLRNKFYLSFQAINLKIMQKTLLSILLTALLLGCGEDPSEFSTVREIKFTFEESDFTPYVGDYFRGDITEIIDPNREEFSGFLGGIDNYFVNEIRMEINSDNLQTAPWLEGVMLSVNDEFIIDENTLDVLDALTTNGVILEEKELLVYNRMDNEEGVVNDDNTGIQAILEALIDDQPLSINLGTRVNGNIVGTFQIAVYLDITARGQF